MHISQRFHKSEVTKTMNAAELWDALCVNLSAERATTDSMHGTFIGFKDNMYFNCGEEGCSSCESYWTSKKEFLSFAQDMEFQIETKL